MPNVPSERAHVPRLSRAPVTGETRMTDGDVKKNAARPALLSNCRHPRCVSGPRVLPASRGAMPNGQGSAWGGCGRAVVG